MINEELKRCPFCNSEAELYKHSGWDIDADDKFYSVECTVCNASTPPFTSNEGARTLWNRRDFI